MDTTTKKDFIKSIIDDLKKEILLKVGMMPEDWDGVEIRQYIADYYSQHYTYGSKKILTGKRKKDYNNECLTSNLI